MDVSTLDKKSVYTLATVYSQLKYLLGKDPLSASAKEKKGICKRIRRVWIDPDDLAIEANRHIQDADDHALLGFLQACYVQSEVWEHERKNALKNICAAFSEPVRQAFAALFDSGIVDSSISTQGGDLLLRVESGVGVDRTLILKCATCSPFDLPGKHIAFMDTDSLTLTKDAQGYLFSGEAKIYEQDEPLPFSLRFDDALVRVIPLRANEISFYDDPWMNLELICLAVLNKYTVAKECLNDRERALLPLAGEIACLYWAGEVPEEFVTGRFPLLRARMQEDGGQALLPLLDRLEVVFFDETKQNKILKKLHQNLNKRAFEPLWRKIYTQFVESQEEYPTAASLYCDETDLDEKRREITALLHARGYVGSYPVFVKTGRVRRIRLACSHNVSYVVPAGQLVAHHIYCTEKYIYDHPEIEFNCGTQLLKNGETPGDVYSCQFDAKGRSFVDMVSYDWGESDQNDVAMTLEQTVTIAAKKAELDRLTKQERKAVGEQSFSLPVFLFCLIFTGGMFGFLWTAGLLLIGIVLTLIFLGPQEIPSLFTDIPWLMFFLLSGGMFGLAFGIFEAINR